MALAYKQPKREVNYSKGMAKSHCGICRYFIESPGGTATCKKVAGAVSADMWCTLFRKK
jgi:hypothetical protein